MQVTAKIDYLKFASQNQNGKLVVNYRGLFAVQWAETYSKFAAQLGYFSRFRHNKNI